MNIISKYFPELSQKQIEQFIMLGKLYEKWNNDINVISRKDISNIYEHHILHSLSIAKIIKFKNNTSILDVGTGGGLPGIPLAIYFPDSHFYLVDSIGKKIKVVNEIIKELQLANTEAEQIRAENVNAKFDFIISRAVTNLPDMHRWVKDKITPPLSASQIEREKEEGLPNGMICLKGGDISVEIRNLKLEVRNFKNPISSLQPPVRIYNIEEFFEEEYFKDKKIVYIGTSSF